MSDIWHKIFFFQNFDKTLTDFSNINVWEYDRFTEDLKTLLSEFIKQNKITL